MTAPMPRAYWREMTAAEVAALDAVAVVAILPLAAIEQHGPHLPLSTDADIVEGILARVALTRGELAGSADDVVELSAGETSALVRTHRG